MNNGLSFIVKLLSSISLIVLLLLSYTFFLFLGMSSGTMGEDINEDLGQVHVLSLGIVFGD